MVLPRFPFPLDGLVDGPVDEGVGGLPFGGGMGLDTGFFSFGDAKHYAFNFLLFVLFYCFGHRF